MPVEANLMEKLTALCKRRGFIFPGSEIYGGLGGFWDYGPLGVELKRHIRDLWWKDMVLNPPIGPDGKEIVMQGVDAALIMNPEVWKASGHVTGFNDPMVDDRETKERFRADQLYGIWLLVADGSRGVAVAGLRQALSEGRFVGSPAATVVASSEGEAFGLAMEPKRLNWCLTFGSQTGCVPENPGNPRAVVEFDIGLTRMGKAADWTYEDAHRNRYWAVLWRISSDMLRTQADKLPSPFTGKTGVLTEPRMFNLMFRTYVGATATEDDVAYLRPETAQGIFVNYRNVLDTSRVKIPFGIAQIGKAFRNEINPRNYTFRSREFEQMEIEFFCKAEECCRAGDIPPMEWYEFWRKVRYDWYVNLGLRSENLRLREQTEDELAHYSKVCADIEYLFPFSDELQELEGVAHRGNYDLTQHQKHSGKDLTYFDDDLWQQDAARFKGDKDAAKKAKEGLPYRYLPTVIEPSAGVDRTALAFLCEAYTEDEAPNDKGQMEKRVVMKFHPKIAPIKAAFFPLVNKAGMPEITESLYRQAKGHFNVFFDVKGAIGRRYRRQDEAGTPFCITVDGDTLEDGTVTIRDRDTLAQIRVGKEHVVGWLQEHLA